MPSQRRRLPSLLVALLALAAVTVVADGAPAGAAVTHTVTTTADTVNGGDGVLSLREAVTAANTDLDDSTIVLAAGLTYSLTRCSGTPNETGNVSGDLNAIADDGALRLEGNGATVEQTCADERVLRAVPTTTLDRVTLTGGDLAVGSGLNGGGVEGSVLTVVDSVVSGNGAEQGGGISARELELVRTEVSGNTAAVGGGILLFGGSVAATVTDSSVTGNTAGGAPGLHFAESGTATIVNSTFSGSTATGVNLSIGSEVNVVGDATITHSTIVGTANGTPLRVSGNLTAFGTVVDDGGATTSCTGMGTVTSLGHNVESDDLCGFDDPTDLVNQPSIGLVALADNGGAGRTHLPLEGGVLDDSIPIADCDPAVTADARGQARPTGAGCEPGAVERGPRRVADAQIKNKNQTAFAGNGVINQTGAGQTRTQSRARGQKATFVVRVQNDGEAVDDLRVQGPGNANGFTVRYFVGTTNVTGAVVAGTHQVGALAPGATAALRVEVTPGPSTRRNQTRSLLIRAASVAEPAQQDVVKATVRRS